MKSNSKLKRNFSKLILIILSGSFIYTLPYFRLNYYDAFMETFGMTNGQMGQAGTYFGIVGAVAYIFGGILCDKVPLRVLMPVSMISTGALGLYLLTEPSPTMVILVNVGWAFTALMAFYPAMMKTVRLLADINEQARAFGIFEGGRGIVNAIIMAAAIAIFGYMQIEGGNSLGIKGVILFYSSVTIVLGVLNIFFLKDVDKDSLATSEKIRLSLIGSLLKKPALWMMVGIIFCTYMINVSYYYIAPYTSAAFGASTVAAVIISSSAQYIRPFASVAGGFLGDRINSSKVLLLAQVISLLGLLFVLLTPVQTSIVPVLLGCILIFTSMYVSQSMHFAIMSEVDFKKETIGTAIGLICFLGYLPESFAHLLSGIILDRYSAVEGYRLFFAILIGLTVIGIGITCLWLSKTKEKRAYILSLAKKSKENVEKPAEEPA